ncbi:hypothetical protein PYV02_14675 [Leifsonia sp. H3M29-4]|jgi:hypothetical protein|uniref:hypothetical protein n=1 Tax=Salinibacterium metalliresistens TaxID=3031321 RepID=UPI0023DBF3E1|nr:hypothetical protein [Salinibacterium metalliresistens]MDF1480327.1 hypothetical protein [Salinibacterium metalliresistens]
MTTKAPFDSERAMAARVANPTLTVFDTGEMYEPHVHHHNSGAVDFDNDEGTTELTLFVHPSAVDADTLVLNIDSALANRLRIVVNDGEIGTIESDGTFEAAQSDGSQFFIDTGMPLARR